MTKVNVDRCVHVCCLRYLEGAHEGFVDTHHATCVIKLPAVVWGRKQCDQLAFGKELISILHNLLERHEILLTPTAINTKNSASVSDSKFGLRLSMQNHLHLTQYETPC